MPDSKGLARKMDYGSIVPHVLLVRPGALGDSILTLPLIGALRKGGTNRVTVLGTSVNWKFLSPEQMFVDVLDFGSADWLGLFSGELPLGERAAKILRETGLVIDFSSSAMLKTHHQNVLQASPPNDSIRLHAAQQLLLPLENRGEDFAADDLVQSTPAELSMAENAFDGSQRLVAIHPGSGGKRKCWRVEKFAQLAAKLAYSGATPIFLFGPADEGLREKVDSLLPRTVPRHFFDSRPLREVLALLRFCSAYVGNDSGASHLAALACPSVVIFGPTDPLIWSPLGRLVTIVRAPDGRLEDLDVSTVLKQLPMESA